MTRSHVSRRAFLMTSGTAVASGAGLASCSRADTHAPQSAAQQSEEGIVYHLEIHHSDLMRGFPPPKDKRITAENWSETTEGLRYAHLHPDHVFRTVPVDKRDAPVWILPRKMVDHGRLHGAQVLWGPTRQDAQAISVVEWLQRSQTDALVAIHDGHIVAEVYCGDMSPTLPHILWCGSKAVLATVLAPFLMDKTLDWQAQVTQYVPEFERTAFKGATIRQVLDQMTGVRCDDCIDPAKYEQLAPSAKCEWDFGTPEFRRGSNGYARSSRALGMFPQLEGEQGSGYYDFLLGLSEQDRPHGSSFKYSDYNTMALQLILERVTQTSYVEHLSRFLQELGVEENAKLIIDPIGTPIGNYGLALTPRDWARWGLMLCEHGRVGSGRVLPGIQTLVDDIKRDPGPERLEGKWRTLMPNCGYRSQFWTASAVRGGDPLFQAAGWCLQKCIIDTARKNVVVRCASFWDQDPNNIANAVTSTHDDLAVWSFMEDVLPELVG